MRDKLSNVLIVLMMFIIMGLGGLYYVKIIQNHEYPLGEIMGLGEETAQDENRNEVTANTDIAQSIKEEERVSINQDIVSNTTNLYVNTNQTGYKYNNKYYYNNLDTYSKAIYDAIVKDLDYLKSGTHVIEIDYDFRVLLNSTNGNEELKKYYGDAVNALNLDIPHLFYIDFSKMYLTIEKTSNMFSSNYRLYLAPEKHPTYLADGFSTEEEVEVAINQVEIMKNRLRTMLQGSDYTKLRELHDWIIDNMEYDLNSSHRSNVYGTLIDRRGVCEAYARTYKYILDSLGIGNVLVTGTGTNSNGVTEDHMWNYVQLNDNWYAVDVTWDDPLIIGGGILTEDLKHRYFLVGSTELFRNHTEKYTISESGKLFIPPTLMVNKY